MNLLVARGATLTLFEACAAGELERVERLVDEDPASIRSYSPDGWTPLHLAAFFGSSEDRRAAARARRRRPRALAQPDRQHAAARGAGRNHKLRRRPVASAPAEMSTPPDAKGWRPLHIAAANNNLDVMKSLIAQGADVTAANVKARRRCRSRRKKTIVRRPHSSAAMGLDESQKYEVRSQN